MYNAKEGHTEESKGAKEGIHKKEGRGAAQRTNEGRKKEVHKGKCEV
jgi:hypothetical protein